MFYPRVVLVYCGCLLVYCSRYAVQCLEFDLEEGTTVPQEEIVDVPTPMVAVSGGRTTLPCNISSPEDEDEVYLVLWYKDYIANPIYSLDSRRRPLSQARHAMNEALSGRAKFSWTSSQAVLELDRVDQEDAGIYSCRVDFKKARTRHSAIALTVVVPPNAPIIKDFNGEVLGGVIGPYTEGDSLHLICQTEGGKPAPSLTWWKRRKLLDQSYEESSLGVTRNELTISKLQRKDLLATLSCKATNNELSSPAEASVTIDINFRPLTVTVEDKRRQLSANKTVQFECRTTGSRPPATISWRKGSTKLKSSRDQVTAQGNTTSELTLTLSSEDNGKFLSCQADNPLIPGSSIEDGWKLEVHYVPQLSLRFGSKLASTNIVEGDYVYFECNIRATPLVSETAWTLNGKVLKTNLTSGVIVSNQSLVLQKVQRFSRGRYSCTARNTEGPGESNTVYLRVQYSPVCKTNQEWTYGAVLHYPVQVTCDVEADPDDVTFWWEFNSSTSGNQKFQPTYTSGTKSTLNYIPRSEADFGSLLCWARNPIGPQKVPCTFSVTSAEAPSSVHNCTLSAETFHSFRVSCSEGRDGGLNQYFYIEVRDDSGSFVFQNVSAHHADFVVDGLKSGTSYAVSIYASNVKGRSPPAVVTAWTLTQPESQIHKGDDWQTNYTTALLLVSGIVGGLTLTIALLVIVIVKTRRRRSTNKDGTNSLGMEKEKSTQNSEKSGDTCSEGCTYNDREEEKVWECIPDVVVFSEKGKPGEGEELAYPLPLWKTFGTSPQSEIVEAYTSPEVRSKTPMPDDPNWSNWIPESIPMPTYTPDQTAIEALSDVEVSSTQIRTLSSDISTSGTLTRLKQKCPSMQTDV